MPIDMTLAAKAPPRKAGGGRAATATKTVEQDVRTVNDKRTDGLIGLAQLGQGLCLMFGQYADAAAIGQHFPPLAKEVANVADTAEIIAKPLDLLIEVGPYGALIAAGMPLVMQIMANHRMLDATRLHGQGVVPPEVLDAQMRAKMAQMQADAMKAQQVAMRQAQEAQKEYEDFMAEQTQRIA